MLGCYIHSTFQLRRSLGSMPHTSFELSSKHMALQFHDEKCDIVISQRAEPELLKFLGTTLGKGPVPS